MSDNVGLLLQSAIQQQQQRHWQAAIDSYQRVLHQQPENITALANLASALKSSGQTDAALSCFRQALALDPKLPQLWFNYANLLQNTEQTEAAENALRQALELDAGLYPAWFNLANLLRDRQQVEEAERCYRKVLALKPDFARAYMNLGNLLRLQGRAAEAVEQHQRAVQLMPDNADAWFNLANALLDNAQTAAAMNALQTVLQKQPQHRRALFTLANLLHQQSRFEESLKCWRRLVAIAPDDADLRFRLAATHRLLKQIEPAVEHFRTAMCLAPGQPQVPVTLASTLLDSGHIGEALTVLQPALQQHPDYAEAHKALGNALVQQSRVDEGLAAYREALVLEPGNRTVSSNLLFAGLYSDRLDGAIHLQQHREQAELIARHAGPRYPLNRSAKSPANTLNIAYLSADFRSHPVGYFMTPVLAGHHPQTVNVTCYSLVAAADETTAIMKQTVPRWHDAYHWSDDQLGQQIQDDQIDILVDLVGHTANNRMALLAQKPAPLQMLYLGYPCTSGLAAMDYYLSDALVSPPQFDHLYSEKVLRLNGCFLCFQPPQPVPAVAPLPALNNNHVTFGSFNHLPKLSPGCRELWAEILQAVPNSRLVLKALSFADKATCERIHAEFETLGIARERLQLLPPSTPLTAYLNDYRRIDIGLDPFPYSASTTTCQALWMGVPVITLAGEHFFARMGVSVLHHAGLAELIADSTDEYIEIAVKLAADVTRLQKLREGMREHLLASTLCDATGFVNNLETAYRQIV